MNRIGLTDSLAIRWGYVLEKLRSENSKATFWAKNVFIRCFPLSSGPQIVKTAHAETANKEGHLHSEIYCFKLELCISFSSCMRKWPFPKSVLSRRYPISRQQSAKWEKKNIFFALKFAFSFSKMGKYSHLMNSFINLHLVCVHFF
jgi:hypothetical protein